MSKYDVPDFYDPDREAEEPYEREREYRRRQAEEEAEWEKADWELGRIHDEE